MVIIAGAAAAIVFAFARGRQLSVTTHGLLVSFVCWKLLPDNKRCRDNKNSIGLHAFSASCIFQICMQICSINYEVST